MVFPVNLMYFRVDFSTKTTTAESVVNLKNEWEMGIIPQSKGEN